MSGFDDIFPTSSETAQVFQIPGFFPKTKAAHANYFAWFGSRRRGELNAP